MSKKAKKEAPKPSTLLAQAFKLFGSKGERWIKGRLNVKPGKSLTISGKYNDSTGDYDNDKKIVYPQGAYCSIGALNRIDTKNEDEATKFLKLAMALDDNITSIDDLSFIDIPENNDDEETKFKDIRRWFTRAIKLAKAVGR